MPDAKLSEMRLVRAFSAVALTVISRAALVVVAPDSVIVPVVLTVTVWTSLPLRRPLAPSALLIDALSWLAMLLRAVWPVATSPAVAV
ncbi:hypothetical protein [Azospirillum brasilense]|uniref:hypothetical protein n=1 Tax=Azospirillum brasilense TaxID=192 RepID=UPI0016590997|nr:hypothetical protein [Azospirillum brasilense]